MTPRCNNCKHSEWFPLATIYVCNIHNAIVNRNHNCEKFKRYVELKGSTEANY